jgi:hypothetical protein
MIANSRRGGRRRRSSMVSRFVPHLECLETREVPSVTQDPGGNVIVTGTAQADTVLVAADTPTTVRVRLNGTDFGPFTMAANNQVSVSTAGANDAITVTAQGRSVVVDGGSGTNTLVGPDATSTWVVSGANTGSLNGNIGFSAIANLRGGSGGDAFQFSAAASLSGSIHGGGGSNLLDYSAFFSPVIVNLVTAAVSAVNTTHSGGIANVQSFIGGTGQNRFFGTNANTTWSLSGSDTGSLSTGFSFSSFGILGGGAGNDTFAFADGATTSGIVNGGGGNGNTLDYSAYTTDVVVSLASNAATGIGRENHNFVVNIQEAIGGSGINTLFGNNTSNVWNITGARDGNINGTFLFTEFDNLRGGTREDSFAFHGGPIENLNGGLGANWLDYSPLPNAQTLVDLAQGTATGVAGRVQNVQHVIGSPGRSSTLRGDQYKNGGNILIGGNANRITAGAGRSLLIGGPNKDILESRLNGTILFPGTTVYTQGTVDKPALLAILAEWQRTDLDYASRVSNIRNGAGLTNGNQLSLGSTAFDDSAFNEIIGSPNGGDELDWFFVGATDTVQNLQPGEQTN